MAYSSFGIKDCADVFLKNLSTNEVIYIPYFNKFSVDLKGDIIYANKQGQKSIGFNKALEGTFDSELEILNPQIMALMLGVGVVKANTDVFKKEVMVTTVADTLTLTGLPKTGSLSVMIPDEDGVMATKTFTVVTGIPTAGQVKILTSTLTFFTGEAPIGTTIFTTYLSASTLLDKFTVYSDASTPNFSLYANVEAKMEANGSADYKQICLPKVSIKRDFKLEFDAEKVATFNLGGTLLADANNQILSWIEL